MLLRGKNRVDIFGACVESTFLLWKNSRVLCGIPAEVSQNLIMGKVDAQ